MNFTYLFAIIFSICIVFGNGQDLTNYDDLAGNFITTTELIQNQETSNSAKELVQSIQEVFAQILQVRKDVNRSVLEITQVYDRFNDINTTDMCQSCQNYLNNLRLDANTTDTFDNLKTTLTNECNNGSNFTETCYYSVADFASALWNATTYQVLDPVRFCQDFSFCPVTAVYQSVSDYSNEVLAGKPEVSLPNPSNSSSYTFLHITDVHVDILYQNGSNAFCGQTAICCRAESGSAADPSQQAQYWGTLSTCDLPYRTFEQFLQFAAQNHQVDFIIWTGDNIAHDIYQQSQFQVEEYTKNTTELIMQYFPNTTVYPMFGNHEVYPMSQFDFINNDTAWLTQYFSQLWGNWLTQDAINSFVYNGYYAEVNEQHNLKVIALNTEACDTYNILLIANPSDPGQQLEWLINQLNESEQANQPVFIMAHIPPGYSSCDSGWGARYRAIVDRYQNIIRGQFFGHTHNDEFEIFRSFSDNSPTGVAFIAPSFTTYPELNPSYRIFEIDSDTNFPINYYQYRLNLTEANANPSQNLTWDLAYDVLSEYNLTDLSWASVASFIEGLYDNLEATQTYANNFYAGGTDVTQVNINDTHTFSCHAQFSVFQDSVNCLGQNATVTDLLYFAVQLLPGQWYFDKGA